MNFGYVCTVTFTWKNEYTRTKRNSYSPCSRPVRSGKHLSSTSHIYTSTTFCSLITQTLRIISVRCIPLCLRSIDTTESNISASYLDLLLSIGRDGQLRTSLYDKRDDFNFHITNFPFLSSNIPSSPAYGVLISQLIRYARACSSYECFILRAMRLSNKLLGQGYVKERLKSSLRKFYGRYGDLTKQYEVTLSRMLHDILDDDHTRPSIDKTLHQFLTITDLDLITEFDFLPNCARFP